MQSEHGVNMKKLAAIMTISTLFSGACAMNAKTVNQGTGKPPIVLVHGAFEDSHVWQGVETKLKNDGYSVQAVELPGRPGNPMPVGEVSLDVYRDTIVK